MRFFSQTRLQNARKQTAFALNEMFQPRIRNLLADTFRLASAVQRLLNIMDQPEQAAG